jgi:hypothetical protein
MQAKARIMGDSCPSSDEASAAAIIALTNIESGMAVSFISIGCNACV